MPKGIPLTKEDLQQRRREIFEPAIALFLEKGFYETSMQEVARAAGIGKSTLYDYFKTKEEILGAFMEDSIVTLTGQAEQIAAQPAPAAVKLRQVLHAHLEYLLANTSFSIKLLFEVQRLSLESQRSIQVKRYAYQDVIARLIEESVREGSFRPVNPLLATRTILTLVTPVVYTTRPTGTPEQMLDEALDIFYNGVVRKEGPAPD